MSHEKRLVSAVIGPGKRRRDYPVFIVALSEAGAISCRKIFDLRFGRLDYTVADVKALSQKVVEWGKAGSPGPTALIVSSKLTEEFARLYSEHARIERQARIFTDTAAAQVWLDEVAPLNAG